jgi:thioredoxin-related protein
MKYILIVSLILLSSFSFAQEDLMDQPILMETFSDEELDVFATNAYSFIGEDFDSLDLEIMLNGTFLGVLLVEVLNENDTLTYGALYNKFLEVKAKPFYAELKEKQRLMSDLMARPADIANWEEDKQGFQTLGMDAERLERLRIFVEENGSPSINYELLMIAYRGHEEERLAKDREQNRSEAANFFQPTLDFDEATVLAQSKAENKPVLLYFTGYTCVNCRKLEQSVLLEPEIMERLKNDFIFVQLYVDDRTELPESEQKEITIGERTRMQKTLGDKYMYYQVQRFDVMSQPYLVILNSDNEIIDTNDYIGSRDPRLFALFLKGALKDF